MSLDLMTKDWHQQVINISQGISLMAESPGELCKTIKPNGDHVWNGSGTIKDLAGLLWLLDRWLADSFDL